MEKSVNTNKRFLLFLFTFFLSFSTLTATIRLRPFFCRSHFHLPLCESKPRTFISFLLLHSIGVEVHYVTVSLYISKNGWMKFTFFVYFHSPTTTNVSQVGSGTSKWRTAHAQTFYMIFCVFVVFRCRLTIFMLWLPLSVVLVLNFLACFIWTMPWMAFLSAKCVRNTHTHSFILHAPQFFLLFFFQ